MMEQRTPGELRVLQSQIFEFQNGVRPLILYTLNKSLKPAAVEMLKEQGIPYLLQRAGKNSVNIYFGREECLDTIKLIVTRPLNLLSPEEDFILGTLLGYDIEQQCERYCDRLEKWSHYNA